MFFQVTAFASGVPPDIYVFHYYTRNSVTLLDIQDSQFHPHSQVKLGDFTDDLQIRLRALYAQSFRTTLAPYVLPLLLARS